MSTQQQLIEDAFAECGILDEETGLEPAMLQRGLREIHRVVCRLFDDGVSIPYYLSQNLQDSSGITSAQEDAIIPVLSLKLMSTYVNERQPSATLLNSSKNAVRVLRNKSSGKPVRVRPSTLPRGAGNSIYQYGNTFYSNQEKYRVIATNNDVIYADDGTLLYFDPETFN